MKVINPATEDVREIQTTDIETIPSLLAEANAAQTIWAAKSVSERVAAVRQFIKIAESRTEELASAITEDMGKPIAASTGEIGGALALAEHYCSNAEEWLQPEEIEGGTVVLEPLGVVGTICPWNYPVYVPLTGMIPALLAGNGILFKPSEYTLSTGVEIAKAFDAVEEIPNGLIQIVVGGKEHGKAVVQSDVQMISFTGSTAAGKHIMENCSKELKRIHLELGGMDAAVVLKDADIADAAEKIVGANCTNSGQICCAAKRVYVEQEIYDDFVQAAAEASKKLTYGDPHTEVDMGPLVADFQLEKVASIVDDARDKGATVHTGGESPEGKGYYYPSTVVTDVTEEMRILTEEPFGPVLPIVAVDSWEEGVEKANASNYGLTSSVWTSDVKGSGQKIAAMLEAGQVGINAHAQPPIGAPFGGAKQSGIGRTESREGMQCYCNTKFVYQG